MFTFFLIYAVSYAAVPVMMESLHSFRVNISAQAQLNQASKEPTFSELYGE